VAQSQQTPNPEIDACIEALHALKLVWRAWGPGPQGHKCVDDIVDLLLTGAHPHARGPRRVFANAIQSNFGSVPPPQGVAGQPSPANPNPQTP
jgi:hypothetical protein